MIRYSFFHLRPRKYEKLIAVIRNNIKIWRHNSKYLCDNFFSKLKRMFYFKILIPHTEPKSWLPSSETVEADTSGVL